MRHSSVTKKSRDTYSSSLKGTSFHMSTGIWFPEDCGVEEKASKSIFEPAPLIIPSHPIQLHIYQYFYLFITNFVPFFLIINS